ncbi:hypothetical protein D3C76_1423770 [compost metagenome]
MIMTAVVIMGCLTEFIVNLAQNTLSLCPVTFFDGQNNFVPNVLMMKGVSVNISRTRTMAPIATTFPDL